LVDSASRREESSAAKRIRSRLDASRFIPQGDGLPVIAEFGEENLARDDLAAGVST